MNKIEEFDSIKEFEKVIEELYNVNYNIAVIIASNCVKRGYSLKYLKEGIYKKSILKQIDKINPLLPR